MRLAILSMFAAAVLSTSTIAQTTEPEFSADRVRGHVTFLADDLLEGREAGTRGYDIAARYVATQFQALGLNPGNGDSWYQDITFRESKLAEPKAALTIGGTRFENGGDVMIGPSARETAVSLSAPVVFAGFGIDAPDQGLNDYAGLDVKGKVVAVLSGFPKGFPSDVGAHLSADKGRMAAARGAIGMISIMTPQALGVYDWNRRLEFLSEPALTWIGPDGQPYSAAPTLRMSASLNTPAAEALFKGARRSLSAILAEADKTGGKPKGFALAQNVGFESASAHEEVTSPNVMAILPGSDPALANEYVMLMAHLDHTGIDRNKTEGDVINNGALDNAAGIATMIEAARAFVTSGTRPKRPILFVAVTAEEKGLLGAQYLAKNPVLGDGRVVGLVNLDMPVLLYDFSDVIAFGAEHSTLGPITERATGMAGVKLSPDPMPEQNLFTRSDHYRFVQEGVPSIFLMTGFAGEGQKQFQGFLATHYHKVSDDLNLPINWDAGAKFARINYLIAREIADAPEAPKWYADSFFGRTFAADAEKAAR